MKKLIKTSLLTFLLFLSSSFLFSQETRIELGDKYYNQHAFEKAIPLYESANKSKKIHAKLGDCYYYTSQPEKAVIEYNIAFTNNEKSKYFEKYRLRYALCLLSVGQQEIIDSMYMKIYSNQRENKNKKIEKARTIFSDVYDINIDRLITQTIDAKAIKEAENLDNINSPNSDFGSFIFNDIFYFSSSREKEEERKDNKKEERKHNKKLFKWNEHPFLEIYTAAIERNEIFDSFKLIPSESSNIKFKTPAHESSVLIVNDSTMYFSGGVVDNKNKIVYNKRGVSNLKLQKAKRTKDSNNKWVLDSVGIEALNFLNLDNYSVGNPALSTDKDNKSKRLFFVSCAPYLTAKGQSDIYYVDMKDGIPDGEVKSVPGINTNGRESFPFVSWDGTLYFSSDGFYNYKLGLGLLDIYKVDNIDQVIDQFIETGEDSHVVVNHLGTPFNSPKDDFAFFMEKPKDSNETTESYAYFSSNREHPEAQCDDDIYRAKMITSKKEKLKNVQVVVIDSSTGEPLKDAFITLMDADENTLQNVQVDSSGTYSFEVNPKLVYKLRSSRAKYYKNEIKTIAFNEGEDISKARVNLKMKPIPCEINVEPIEFKLGDSIIQENEGKKLKPLIKLLSENRELSIIIESHTDSVGSLIANMKLSQRRANQTKAYLISKNVYESQITNAIGQGENCPLFTTSYIRNLPTREERLDKHKKNRRSVFILEDCEDYVSDCKKNEP